MKRRGFSLVEVLTVMAVVSGSLLVVFGLLQGTARENAFNKHHVIAWQLLSNMYERYHLVPPTILEGLFGTGNGEDVIAQDVILNHPEALSLAELKRLGIRRSAFYKKVGGGLRAHGVLHLVVSWTGVDGREHAISHDVLPADPTTGPLAWLASLRGTSPTASPSPDGTALPDGRPDTALHPLIQLLRRKDAKDGKVDLGWPLLPATERLSLVVTEVLRVLASQNIPDGIYDYEWETVQLEATSVRTLDAARPHLVVLQLTDANGHVWLMLREDYPAEGRTLRVLDGEPLAARGDRWVLTSPRPPAFAAPTRSRAHVDVSPTHVLIYRQRADVSGHEIPTSQTLELAHLPPQAIDMLRKDRGTRDRYLKELELEVDTIAASAGLDRTDLPPDPAAGTRLGW